LADTKGEEFVVVSNDYHLHKTQFSKEGKGKIRTIKGYEGPRGLVAV